MVDICTDDRMNFSAIAGVNRRKFTNKSFDRHATSWKDMASIKERNGKFVVIYSYKDENDNRKQKWETYKTKSEAKKRKQEIEYKQEMGSFIVPQCHTVKDLLDAQSGNYDNQFTGCFGFCGPMSRKSTN